MHSINVVTGQGSEISVDKCTDIRKNKQQYYCGIKLTWWLRCHFTLVRWRDVSSSSTIPGYRDVVFSLLQILAPGYICFFEGWKKMKSHLMFFHSYVKFETLLSCKACISFTSLAYVAAGKVICIFKSSKQSSAFDHLLDHLS